MSAIITIIHALTCLVLIMAVLLQSGKAADLAGAFGGVGSQTAFGARGTASLLSKATQISAILFMLTSLGLWIISGRETKSALSEEKSAPVKAATTTETKKEKNPAPAQAASAAASEKEKKQPDAKRPEAATQGSPQKTATGQETKK